MSQGNVETVRRAYEVAYAERSVEGVMDVVAENFVWHQRAEWPGLPCTGLKTCRSFGRTLDDTYTEYSLVPEHFRAVGEYVMVTVRTGARMRAGDARIDSTLYHVWHLRDGKVREAWTYSTQAEAL